ncbi:MAG: toll/interleukin-1 receptor domain-containing protein, partial [Bacteroidia bacterium]|nr:toll/interleukin-1 receptor domain-containing protein [Bacteroidia bacterium]
MDSETIFVSYSSKDRPFAIGLVEELERLGAKVWIDQKGIKFGDDWDNTIEEALNKSETFLLIISPTAIESRNVHDEVSIAIIDEKRMVPLLIKPCKLPMRWQRIQYADLVNNPDEELEKVLNFLGLEAEAASNLKELLTLINDTESDVEVIEKKDDESPETSSVEEVIEPPKAKAAKKVTEDDDEGSKKDLLISEAQIDKAVEMHKRGIKKNWQMIGIIGAITIGSLAVILITEMFTIDPKLLIGIG